MSYVFIGCGSKKNNKSCKAKEMYTSYYFKSKLKYALSITEESNIFILSAKYGLLRLNDLIEPYNLRLPKNDKSKKEWAFYVYKQMKHKGIDFTETAIFLYGEDYYKYLKKLFKNNEQPLKNKGIGHQLQFLKKINNT